MKYRNNEDDYREEVFAKEDALTEDDEYGDASDAAEQNDASETDYIADAGTVDADMEALEEEALASGDFREDGLDTDELEEIESLEEIEKYI